MEPKNIDGWSFVIFIRPTRGICILRSGINGCGRQCGTFQLDPDGLTKARAKAVQMAGKDYLGEIKEIQQDENKVVALERRAAKQGTSKLYGKFVNGRVIRKSLEE